MCVFSLFHKLSDSDVFVQEFFLWWLPTKKTMDCGHFVLVNMQYNAQYNWLRGKGRSKSGQSRSLLEMTRVPLDGDTGKNLEHIELRTGI